MLNHKYNESDLYIIQAITNLHVGSGDNNFGIIDNQVQRDVLTNRPTINSSSLKGSLREHFESKYKSEQFIKYVFGSPPKEKEKIENQTEDTEKSKIDKTNEQEKGKLTFIGANLLILPLRSNTKTFFRVTSPEIIQEFLENLDLFEITLQQKELLEQLSKLTPQKEAFIFEKIENETIIEDTKAVYVDKDLSSLEDLLGKNLAIMNNTQFNEYCKNLPVIARNHLENGESQNLWYEEIVPRESRFYYIVTKPTNLDKDDSDRIGKFEKQFNTDELIQIGANATIGYGYTKMIKIEKVQ